MAANASRRSSQRQNYGHKSTWETKENDVSSTKLLAVLLCFTAQAFTILLILEQFPNLKRNSVALVCIGVGALTFFMVVAHKLFQLVLGKDRAAKIPVSAAFFTVTCWSACIDLIFTLSLLGFTNIGSFYMHHGEEYFRTAYGVGCLGYDGTIHLLLQIYLAHSTLLGRNDSNQLFVGLFWAGSIINSMPPLLMGGATGAFSATIKPSTALNAPYVLIPIAYAVSIFANNDNDNTNKSARRKNIPCVDFVRISGHVLSIIFHIIRCMAVLDSQSTVARWWTATSEPILDVASKGYADYGVVRVQMLQNFFYLIPYHGACVSAIMSNHQSATYAKLSVLVAGASLNAQSVYVTIGSVNLVDFGDLRWLEPPSLFYLVNAGALCFALIDALVCWKQMSNRNQMLKHD